MGVITHPRREIQGRNPKTCVFGFNFAPSAAAVKGTLNLSALCANLDISIEAKAAGADAPTFEVRGTSAAGVVVTVSVPNNHVLVEFEDDVSTVEDVTDALDALAGSSDELVTVSDYGTPANVLNAGQSGVALDEYTNMFANLDFGFLSIYSGADYDGGILSVFGDGVALTAECTLLENGKWLTEVHYIGGTSTQTEIVAAINAAAAAAGCPYRAVGAGVAGIPKAGNKGGLVTFGGAAGDGIPSTALTGGSGFAAVTDIVGGEREIESITHDGAGLYTVKTRDSFPELLAFDISVAGSAGIIDARTQGISFDPVARTYEFRLLSAAGAEEDPAGTFRIHVLLVLANLKDGRIAGLV